jgi:5,10-methylenetetrahydromethanopterin reductase
MRIDVILESKNAPQQVLELGRLAEDVGLGGVWVSNMNDARDPFINFVPLAMQTEHIRLGPIAISPFELHPLKMASSLMTLNEVAGGRAQIVVGAGGGTATAMGLKPTRVVRAVRECVEILKASATGKPVSYHGEIFDVGWYNPAWIQNSPPCLYVGANGPQMLRAAARYADGIMVSDFTIERVRWAREIIDSSLVAAGRTSADFPLNNFWAWHVKDDAAAARREACIWLAVRGTIYPNYIGDILDEDEASIVTDNIQSFIRAYHHKTDRIDGVPDAIIDRIVAACTSASSVAALDVEIERMQQFKATGLTEIALRIYADPAASIRLIGERLVPALAD